MSHKHERVAVVGGIRTPFVKAGAQFRDYSMQQLGEHVLRELVKQSSLKPTEIDEFVFSSVLLDPRTPNWAREIVLSAGLPKTLYAHSVSNNCISGLVAITGISERIALGLTHCGIAGGSESMSNPAVLFTKRASKKFLTLSRARSTGERLRILASLRPSDLFPAAPSITEPSTGLSMGEHMEITAKELNIARKEQDEIAFKSHQNAATAMQSGAISTEIAPLGSVSTDTLVRKDTSLEKLSKLLPVFDRSSSGTLTAGNSSPLTDGASVVLLMSETRAREQGREILAFITHYEFSAIDANSGLLMAPAVAVPKLLKRAGISFSQIDRFEVHEAFGAQVAANIKAWETGLMGDATGPLDRTKLNVQGGSIALGHPFAATGGRIVTSLARDMARNNLKRGLISICAAGAMAGAMLLERD